MTSFTDLMTIAKDINFQNRVNFCMISAAIAVMAEDPTPAVHVTRSIFARTILNGTANVFQFAIGVVNNATIASKASTGAPDFGIVDNDILFAVQTSLFNSYAGIST